MLVLYIFTPKEPQNIWSFFGKFWLLKKNFLKWLRIVNKIQQNTTFLEILWEIRDFSQPHIFEIFLLTPNYLYDYNGCSIIYNVSSSFDLLKMERGVASFGRLFGICFDSTVSKIGLNATKSWSSSKITEPSTLLTP